MGKQAIVVHESDNVATSLRDLKKGEEVLLEIGDTKCNVVLLNDIPFAHKFALKNIYIGENVIKYGEVIGKASKPIKMGEHVHVHNIESTRGRGDLEVDKR
ncbi:UxaA family hydrolase [Acetomicrobium sp.]|jgi:altronate dehydratase small subunit|uniref:UxaA family hydrolase n=1 Tax=Acetomicrobium sp. TaxID=1872099 RepID=UPI001BCCA87C|nr:UxaA family hydrolase [Acetomicrobium sp.]